MTTPEIIDSSIIYEQRELVRQRFEQRTGVTAQIRGRKQVEKQLQRSNRALWQGRTRLEFAPKYQRKLAEEEPTSQIRYGFDAVPRRLMTISRYPCTCPICTPEPVTREERTREIRWTLRRVVDGKQLYGRLDDVNNELQSCPLESLEEWESHQEEEKVAGPAFLDLMAMAKPARRRRPQRSRILRQPVPFTASLSKLTADGDSTSEDEEPWENIEDVDVDLSVIGLEDEDEDEWERWSDL